MTKKMISSFLFGISFFLFAILIPHNAAAKTVIADTAHALSTDESDQIIEQCDTIYDHYNTSVYITITKKLGDQDDYIKYMDKIGTIGSSWCGSLVHWSHPFCDSKDTKKSGENQAAERIKMQDKICA